MSAEITPLIVIPARMASTRLPGKPLADIAGKPMIVQVLDRARESGLGRVVVAAAEQEVMDAVLAAGGEAVMTDPDLPSGSDRVWAAVQACDPEGQHDTIINMQGDLPNMSPADIAAVAAPLRDKAFDVSTLVTEIVDEDEKTDPNVVKCITAFAAGERVARALYFTRVTAPGGDGPLFHHIGIYGYRRAALERFVSLKPSLLEVRERLEQLRALEDGMSIGAALVDETPVSVDTPEDLEKARKALGHTS